MKNKGLKIFMFFVTIAISAALYSVVVLFLPVDDEYNSDSQDEFTGDDGLIIKLLIGVLFAIPSLLYIACIVIDNDDKNIYRDLIENMPVGRVSIY